MTQTGSEDRVDLSVVVASFNVAPLLRECLASLPQAFGGLSAEVLVVDNNSQDGSPALVRREFPAVQLIANGENEGFARANNHALARARGRYVLLLNPDTRVPAQTLGPMVAFMDQNPDVGVAGPRVVRPDGRLDDACRRGFPTPLNALSRFLALDRVFPGSRLFGAYRQTFRDPKGRYEVDSVVGAVMLVRREALDRVGKLDETFFMFGEDLDWCWRFKDARWRIFYLGDLEVVHHKGASCVSAPHRMNWHFHRSMVIFHRKHLEMRYPFFVNWMVYGGVGVRYVVKSLSVAVKKGAGARSVQNPDGSESREVAG